MKDILRPLTIFASTLSVISLVQQIFDVGLTGIFLSLIEYYRLALSKVFTLLSINISQALLDLWILSFIGASAYIRTPNIEQSRLLRNYDSQKFWKYWKVVYFLILGVTFIGCGLLLAILTPYTYVDEMNSEPQNLMQCAAKNMLWVLTGLALFFALNAYAPSA